MQCVIIVSVLTLTATVTVLDAQQLFIPANRVVQPRDASNQVPPSFLNHARNYANFVPNIRQPQNQPLNNLQWIPIVPTNVLNKQGESDFARALNNLINIQSNLGNEAHKSHPGLAPQNGKLLDTRQIFYNGVPQQNQIPYVTHTTQDSRHHNGVQTPNQKQHSPPVNPPNTVTPLIELDFNAKNPFGPNQQATSPLINQIPLGTRLQKPIQPAFSFDIDFGSAFPHNHPLLKPKPPSRQSLPGVNINPNHPFNKNHRDDNTHEPVPYDPQYFKQETPKVERSEPEKAPISEHEHPADVPTKPIYPGEGQWSKPGIKHRPYVGPERHYENLEETREIPAGFDTFLEAENFFEKDKNQFPEEIHKIPQQNNLGKTLDEIEQEPNEDDEEVEEEEEDEVATTKETINEDLFIPTRLYAQVRHSEDEKHLPPESDENGRLKELVKDTKVQTIYSEEGYEDLAYDHAGHEKNAEKEEDHEKSLKAKDKSEALKEGYSQSVLPSPPEKNIKYEEEDLQQLKDHSLDLDDDDSETAGTHQDKSVVVKDRPPKKVYSAQTKGVVHTKLNATETNDNKWTNPTSTIVKGKGNTDIEISSEIKFILEPNNTTKSHKFVKIYPKYRPDNKSRVQRNTKYIEKEFIQTVVDSTTTHPLITATPTKEDIFTVEIPATTQATTAIPKSKISRIKDRKRRYTNDFHKITVDTDFIDKINHTLPKKADLTKKYPYYNNYKKIGLNEGSPLRYSETLQNVPFKTAGNLAFYNQADRLKPCPDVVSNVDPVPDKIKEADQHPDDVEDATDVAELAEAPRLGELGDSIDCFKERYFGKNPFDSPLFKEKSIGKVKPIFDEIEKSKNSIPGIQTVEESPQKLVNVVKYNRTKRDTENTSPENKKVETGTDYRENEIEEDNHKNDYKEDVYKNDIPPGLEFDDSDDSGENSEEQEQPESEKPDGSKNDSEEISENDTKAEQKDENTDETNKKTTTESEKELPTLAPATLITTPKYTIDKKPKHIYDQIELLKYLPLDEYDDITTEKPAETTPAPQAEDPDDKLGNKDKTEDIPTTSIPIEKEQDKENEDSRIGQIVTEQIVTARLDRLENDFNLFNNDNFHKFPKSPQDRNSRILKEFEDTEDAEKTTDPTPPQAEALRGNKRIKVNIPRPTYNVFDINAYIPTIPTPEPGIADIVITKPPKLKLNIPNTRTFQIFDINKYIPTTPYPIVTQGTVLPKYKVVSEVFYKNNINPNEQLNVFTDVFNNIKNSPSMQQDMQTSASEQISLKLNVNETPLKVIETKGDINSDHSSKISTNILSDWPKNHRIRNSGTDSVGQRIETQHHQTERVTTYKPVESNIHRHYQTHNPKKTVQEIIQKIKDYKGDSVKISNNEKADNQTVNEDTDANEVMGLVPPENHGYKTIYNTKRDNKQELSDEEATEIRSVNKFLVPGMKPPPMRRVYDYSHYMTANHIKQTKNKPKRRHRRSAARPTYAELSRNRGSHESVETMGTKVDEDDYVPHRLRNYHYDEETGKIVYDKKPNEPDVDIDYVEITEAIPTTTSVKPKQNPIFATVTPPPEGQSYTDFVALLKSHGDYHEIPDPTTTEKMAEATAEAVSVTTIKSELTSPPEYIFILSKVKNDSNYKFIEDKTDEKNKPKTATTLEPQEEHIVEGGETQVDNIQNSPGAMGVVDGENFKIFDITEFLPKVKSYLPKTSVDTSRYKSIERSTVKHNTEEEVDATTKKTKNSDSEQAEVKEMVQDKVIAPVTVRSLRRGTTTAKSSLVTTDSPTTVRATRAPIRRRPVIRSTRKQDIVTAATIVNPEKTRRASMSRRNSRFRLSTTTESSANEETNNETNKSVLRRSERDNFKRSLNTRNNKPLLTEEDSVVTIRPLRRRDRYLGTAERNKNEQNEKQNSLPLAQQVVQVFKNYDKSKKHGGNYRREEEAVRLPIQRRKELNKILNEDLEVFKSYDKNRKHGGNYRPESHVDDGARQNDALKVAPEIDDKVDVFKEYDKSKKHGGNYKWDKDAKQQQALDGSNSENANDVTSKVNELQLEESRVETPDKNRLEENEGKDAVAFKGYDKTNKHGGNYMTEDEFEEKRKQNTEEEPKDKDVEIFNNYDKSKKHGGNYKPETATDPDTAIDPQNEEAMYDQTLQKRDQQHQINKQRDDLFNPESYYTDPKLPSIINDLKMDDALSHDEIEKIVATDEDMLHSQLNGDHKRQQREESDFVPVRATFPTKESSPRTTTTTEKPLFIKDPDKRLYFYAPI